MKRTCISLAALALAAIATTPAMAQSNVTLSGTIDVGVSHGDKTTRLGGISRSNFVLSGSEDLGGGLAATFKLNSRFHLDTGALEDTKTLWSGESTVGLKGAFGQVRFGRALTALWQNDWAFDPWYNYDSIASPAWQMWHGNSPADPNVSAAGASWARLNNGIFYDSPSFGGVSVHVSGGVEKGAADNNRSLSGAVKYGNGPLALMLAAERTPLDNKVTFVGAKYGFGAFTLMGAYDHEKLADGSKNRSYTLGGQYSMGANTFNVGYGRQQDYKANFFSAGAIHALSKRTNVYASVGHKGKNFWGSTDNATAYGVGLNHSF